MVGENEGPSVGEKVSKYCVGPIVGWVVVLEGAPVGVVEGVFDGDKVRSVGARVPMEGALLGCEVMVVGEKDGEVEGEDVVGETVGVVLGDSVGEGVTHISESSPSLSTTKFFPGAHFKQ